MLEGEYCGTGKVFASDSKQQFNMKWIGRTVTTQIGTRINFMFKRDCSLNYYIAQTFLISWMANHSLSLLCPISQCLRLVLWKWSQTEKIKCKGKFIRGVCVNGLHDLKRYLPNLNQNLHILNRSWVNHIGEQLGPQIHACIIYACTSQTKCVEFIQVTKRTGQWLWLRWQISCFRYQMSAV